MSARIFFGISSILLGTAFFTLFLLPTNVLDASTLTTLMLSIGVVWLFVTVCICTWPLRLHNPKPRVTVQCDLPPYSPPDPSNVDLTVPPPTYIPMSTRSVA